MKRNQPSLFEFINKKAAKANNAAEKNVSSNESGMYLYLYLLNSTLNVFHINKDHISECCEIATKETNNDDEINSEQSGSVESVENGNCLLLQPNFFDHDIILYHSVIRRIKCKCDCECQCERSIKCEHQ